MLRYHVPQAAIPVEGGGMRYAIDIDPQGTVIPSSYSVLLRLPEGFREADQSTGDWDVNPDLTLDAREHRRRQDARHGRPSSRSSRDDFARHSRTALHRR